MPSVHLSSRRAWRVAAAVALGLAITMLTPVTAYAEAVRATLTWDTATDIDLHVWDDQGNHAYYGAPNGIPDAYLSTDETAGFGPENFTETANEGRAYTFGVCYYSGEGTTTTALQVTDPGGGQRNFSQVLNVAKDGALITDSPAAGNPYDPPANFCNGRQLYTREEVRACDRDTKTYYVMNGSQRRVKITHTANTCVLHLYNEDGTSCSKIESFDSWIESASSVTKLKPTKTLRRWGLDPFRLPDKNSTGCGALYPGEYYSHKDYYAGKYSIVKRFAGDPIAEPKLSVYNWAGNTNAARTIPEDMREALTRIGKISGWRFQN